MDHNDSLLTIEDEVLAKMAGMAALEVSGVAALAKLPSDVKTIFKTGEFTRSVKVDKSSGDVVLSVYIKVKSDALATEVAESVQQKVKEDIQNMTGNAISAVNVIIADIEFTEDEQ